MTEQPLEEETITPTPNTRKTNTNTKPGEPALAQVIIRTTPENRDRWKTLADLKGTSLSEIARQLLDDLADKTLNCKHPSLRTYPWSTHCRNCGIPIKKK